MLRKKRETKLHLREIRYMCFPRNSLSPLISYFLMLLLLFTIFPPPEILTLSKTKTMEMVWNPDQQVSLEQRGDREWYWRLFVIILLSTSSLHSVRLNLFNHVLALLCIKCVIIQQLDTLYLGENYLRVVCERLWRIKVCAQSRAFSRLELASDLRLMTC